MFNKTVLLLLLTIFTLRAPASEINTYDLNHYFERDFHINAVQQIERFPVENIRFGDVHWTGNQPASLFMVVTVKENARQRSCRFHLEMESNNKEAYQFVFKPKLSMQKDKKGAYKKPKAAKFCEANLKLSRVHLHPFHKKIMGAELGLDSDATYKAVLQYGSNVPQHIFSNAAYASVADYFGVKILQASAFSRQRSSRVAIWYSKHRFSSAEPAPIESITPKVTGAVTAIDGKYTGELILGQARHSCSVNLSSPEFEDEGHSANFTGFVKGPEPNCEELMAQISAIQVFAISNNQLGIEVRFKDKTWFRESFEHLRGNQLDISNIAFTKAYTELFTPPTEPDIEKQAAKTPATKHKEPKAPKATTKPREPIAQDKGRYQDKAQAVVKKHDESKATPVNKVVNPPPFEIDTRKTPMPKNPSLKHFVSTWVGDMNRPYGDPIYAELALWITKEPDVYSLDHQQNFLLGLLRIPQTNCYLILDSSPNRTDHFIPIYGRKADVDSNSSTWQKNAKLFLGSWVDVRMHFNSKWPANDCWPSSNASGVAIDSMVLSSGSSIELHFSDMLARIKPRTTTFYRTKASSELNAQLARLNSDFSNTYTEAPKSSPNKQQLALINATSPTEEQIQEVSLDCANDWRPFAITLAEQGVFGIMGVKNDDRSWIALGWQDKSKNDFTRLQWTRHNVIGDGSVDWNGLQYGPGIGVSSTRHCVRKEIVTAFTDYLANNALALTELPEATDLHILNTLNEIYLVDESGVDKVTASSGKAYREFGTTSIFRPGDQTWHIEFSEPVQRIFLSASVKNSWDGEIIRDTLGPYLSRNLQYEEALSTKYGTDVWKLGQIIDKSEYCTYWHNDHKPKNCRKDFVSDKEDSNPTHYVTFNKDVSIELFKQLSPNAAMIEKRPETDRFDSCESSPFCELPFGGYFNAIYRGDLLSTQFYDAQIIDLLLQKIGLNIRDSTCSFAGGNGCAAKMEEGGNILNALFKNVNKATQMRFLYNLAKNYMYYYKEYPSQCFSANSVQMTATGVIEGVKVDDMMGDTVFETSDYEVSTTYRINPEFKRILENEASAHGPLYELINKQMPYVTAIKELQQYGCNSKEVKQFERNLRDMYWKMKNAPKPYWVRNSY